MEQKWIFRSAALSDAEALSQLAHELNFYHGDSTKPSAENLRRDWVHFEAFVVERASEIAGFLTGYASYQFHNATLGFEIQNLFVREADRRFGIGRRLVENTISFKYRQGVRRFALGVKADNAAARTFYDVIGFTQRPQDHFRYALGGDDLDAFIEESFREQKDS